MPVSTPAMLNAPEPPWFDDWLPEVAVNPQGAVYALWFDWSDAPRVSCGGQSQSYMARSSDGGQSWASLGPVSDTYVNWTFTNSNIIPNQGDYMGLFANPSAVYTAWTDARIGTPDIWTAKLPVGGIQVEIVSLVADTVHVAITWKASGPYPASAEVVRVSGGVSTLFGPTIGTVVFNPSGVASYSDSTVLTSTQYRYALRMVVGASTQVLGERSVITPGPPPIVPPQLTFLGVTPNPSKGSLRVRFTLPDDTKADLRLYDITGRPLRWQEYRGKGIYDLDLAQGLDLKAGLYFLKLDHGSNHLTRRVSYVP